VGSRRAFPDEPARLHAWVAVRTGKVFDDRGILRQLTQAEWLKPRRPGPSKAGEVTSSWI
jgi:hypothetical protein